ncbi:peptide/nickel transport system substrate-binding protein [Actinoplanes campanulatus]|uniref:Peptide/nickel transport system substrate-binding protein n=1 Tax=Actinoplanes campanulatus TaxID=113559 RepID=A0A7W5AAR3_9ACTN|nr:ABC transporter substrate-binding protein [Actinoplanes campanulatus]MBB3092580.1 peptide/nickel transport system substrate-binding protein [Actinoplanes campanulatus]GGM97546.1 peptide ABC transporter substrate-binding protein [Actinoplanes campanulatus]GID34325.1 peptide ABC transporter substrate-binding protein [Actinoplanes campanulatus]
MQRRRLFALALAGVLAGGGLAACGDSPNDNKNAANGGKVDFLSIGMPNGTVTENNNPFIGTSAGASLGYRWMIYEPLGQWNNTRPSEPLTPWLASEIKWSADYKTVDLVIRDGATWSDGKPLTAEDVVFTHTMIKSNEALNIFAIPYDSITADGNKVKMTFKTSQFTTHHKVIGQTPIVPKHIWEKIADPATDTIKEPVGSGPYVLKSFSQQATILAARESGYWGTKPAVKELRYTSFADNNAQATALSSGASEWSFVFIPNYQQTFVAKDPEHFKVWAPGVLGIHGLYINTTKKPFDDPKLRQAMNMVINRNDIFVQAEAGYFHPEIKSVTGLPEGAGDAYIADEYKGKTFSVDAAGAKKLLEESGYKFDGTKLLDKSGKPVTIKLTDPGPWSDYQTTLEIIKSNLAEIGIEATVEKPNQNIWDANVQKGDFDATLRWTNGGSTPFDIYQTVMDGDLYKPLGTAAQQGNFGRFQSPEATAALKAYSNATDEAARKTALATIQKIFVEQAPMLPVGSDNVGGAYSTKNWVGWPSDADSYAPLQPTQAGALTVVLKLQPANS